MSELADLRFYSESINRGAKLLHYAIYNEEVSEDTMTLVKTMEKHLLIIKDKLPQFLPDEDLPF